MKKIIKKYIGLLLALSVINCNTFVYTVMANESSMNISAQTEKSSIIIESSGWHESAYVKWNAFADADTYNVYYKVVGTDNFIKIDNELIRVYSDYFIADAVGLKAGKYVLKVVPVIDNEEIEILAVQTEELNVDNFVREGFAFSDKSPYKYTTGAYNQDGTLKDGAYVVYVTNSNKDIVTINGDESLGIGITEIFSKREKSKSKQPIAVRLLGKVELPKDVDKLNYMLPIQNTENVTIEGIGDDAVVHGYGFTAKRACNMEFRNFAVMWYGGGGDGDSISLDTDNKNVWIHNMDFFYGHGKDADQAKGDGSVDFKSASDYITVSHCHFWDSGKALVSGGPNEAKNPNTEKYKFFATYHHNWFDHSDSRHPRVVSGSVHVYNNYYDGVAKYGVGAAVKSSVFVENNYFRNCPRPMLIATQGSDVYDNGIYTNKGTLSGQAGGMIKEYGNKIIGAKRYYSYQTTPDVGEFDAYTAENRNERVPDTVKAKLAFGSETSGSIYNNFDTDENIMYSYSPDSAEDVKDKVILQAGRRNGGDFKFTFNNDIQDTNSAVIPELQSAIINYKSNLIAVKGITEKLPEDEDTTENTSETTTENLQEESKLKFGDADGVDNINVNDAAILLKKILDRSFHLPIEDKVQDYEKYLDVDKNGILTASDVAIILQKALNSNFIMPVEKDLPLETSSENTTNNIDEGSTENTSNNTTELSTENTTENMTEPHTGGSVDITNSWYADEEIPNWIDLTGCTQDNKSSSHKAFKDTDNSISLQKKIYRVSANSEITINLVSESSVTIYIAGDDNGDGKGTVSATLDSESVGLYSMPGRQTTSAEPFVINTTKGGNLKITSNFKSILFKITTSRSGETSKPIVKEKYDVSLKITNNTSIETTLTIGENTVSVPANEIKEEIVKLENSNYTVAVSGTKVKANPSSITVNGIQTIEISINEIDENVVVTNKDGGYIKSYETITAALTAESTVDGSIILIKPGYYKETFDVEKSVTLKKSEDEGEVVIYSTNGEYGGSMKGIIRVSGTNVIFKDLTLLNNTNVSYRNIQATSTGGTTAAALIADGENSVYDNCKFISVQDTIVSKGKSLAKQTYNDCSFYGATDFVCGSCDIEFNNCEFRYFTGSLKEKKDAYIFAPNINAKWTVNGGKIINDENSIVENFFYARAWESNSSNNQTLDIFGIENNLKMGSKGIMGFGSSTGSGASHSIDEFKFNVYEGNDKNSPLIATSNVTGIDIFEIDADNPIIKFKNKDSSNLIVGNFGKGLSRKFIENIIPDIMEIGFVSIENAYVDLISENNTIKITGVYKTLNSEENADFALSSSLSDLQGSFFGSGVLSGISGEKKVTLVPYVKYDSITDSNRQNDTEPTYKFGNSVEIILKGTGSVGSKTEPSKTFHISDIGIFGMTLPDGIGENSYSNLFGV